MKNIKVALMIGLSFAFLTATTHASSRLGSASTQSSETSFKVGHKLSDYPQLESLLDEAQANGSSVTKEDMQNWLDSAGDKFAKYIDGEEGISTMSSEDMKKHYDSIYEDFALFISDVDPQESIKGYPSSQEAFQKGLNAYLDSASPPTEEQMRKAYDNIPKALDAFLSGIEKN